MKADFAAIILAAGEGRRMKSSVPKVLHKILGKPMIERTIETLSEIQPFQIITVVSPQNSDLLKGVLGNKTLYATQSLPLGTADATQAGLKKVGKDVQIVAVLYGDDTAFYKPSTIQTIYNHHQEVKPKITFATLVKENPKGLGRIIRKDDKVIDIIEEKDASDVQKQIKEVNDGLYFFEKKWLTQNLPKIGPSPKTGEFYITDLIELALKNRQRVEAYKLADPSQWHGINTPQELKQAQNRGPTPLGVEPLKKIHIMGVAGAGAAAVAAICKAKDFDISGCDLNPKSAYATNLKGIPVKKGHSHSHLANVDLLVVSPAVLKFDPTNEEIKYAAGHHIPVMTWQKFQGDYLQKGKFVICISGAYGKSTTTGMISQILIDAHLDPTCEIGAKVIAWGSNFRVGESNLGPQPSQTRRGPHGTAYYVCEGDEYNNNFLNYKPDIAVILNVAWDHPDFFKTKESVITSYKKFIKRIKKGGTLIICDNSDSQELTRPARSGIKIVKVGNFSDLQLSIIGNFRKENAAAALTLAKVLGLDAKLAKKSLESFQGIGRRLEYKGQIKGVKFYDDYAVQPYTVKTTADALKTKFSKSQVCLVFEPHTFSRIKTFFDEFVKALTNTKIDRVVITNVYAAREKGNPQKLSWDLAKSIGQKAFYAGSLKKTAAYLKDHLNQFDVICSMGAGDIYKLYDLLK